MMKQFNGNVFLEAVGSSVLRVVLFTWRISICGCEFRDPLTAKCVCVLKFLNPFVDHLCSLIILVLNAQIVG